MPQLCQSRVLKLVAMAVVCCCTLPAVAQDNMAARLQRQLRQVEFDYALKANTSLNLTERARIDIGAVNIFSFLAVDDTQQRTRLLKQTDTQLFAYANIDNGVHEAFGRLRIVYQDFHAGDSFDGGPDGIEYPLSDRYWYKFDLRRAIEAYQGTYSKHNFRLQIGRQYVHWASGMVFSDQLHAVRAWFEYGNWFELEGLAGTTPASSFYDFDSSRPSFDGDTKRNFFGGKLTLSFLDHHKPYIYGLIQRDKNTEDTYGFPNLIIPYPGTQFEYDSNYIAIGSTGTLHPQLYYEIEGIHQTGQGLSNTYNPLGLGKITQTMEDVEAWAARLYLRYNFLTDQRTYGELEAIYATGDDDRDLDTSNTFGGNAPGTDDNAFNAFGFVNTGLAFAAPVSNLTMVRVGANSYPLRSLDGNLFRRLQVGVDGFLFFKTDDKAPLDEPTNNKSFLGSEIDTYVNWRLTSDVSVFMRYGLFFPGPAINDDGNARHFLYTGISYSF